MAMSNLELYVTGNSQEEMEYYAVFFQMCKKYNVCWSTATQQEKAFVEEVTRITYERAKAEERGIPLEAIRPAFAPA